MKIITPNFENVMAENDSESIQRAINYAHETGVNSVTIPRIPNNEVNRNFEGVCQYIDMIVKESLRQPTAATSL